MSGGPTGGAPVGAGGTLGGPGGAGGAGPLCVDEAERRARVGLSLVSLPVRAAADAVRIAGPVDAWRAHARRDDDRVDRLVDASAAAGLRFVVPGDPEWPRELDVLSINTREDPTRDDVAGGRHLGVPFGLWVRGPLLPPSRAVAVVGARAASGYGQHVAGDLGAGLAERGVCVVSGAAYGVDAAAHRGALAVGGHTVAVLACGLDLAYPLGHEALLARIAETGSVVSEQPLGTSVRRETFLHRNRLIAALTRGAVLVEAGLRSGARNTIAHARRLDRVRMVVPGPVTSALSAGCHAWVQTDEDAKLVVDAADVLELVGDAADLGTRPTGAADPRDDLGQTARGVLERLPVRRPWPLERVAATSDLDAVHAFGILSALVGAGLVEEHDGGYRLTALGRAPTRRGG